MCPVVFDAKVESQMYVCILCKIVSLGQFLTLTRPYKMA